MAPQSRILTALARARLQKTGLQHGRTYSAKAGARAASPTWDSPARRVGGTLMMFVPVTAVVMFWPAAVWPVMDWWADKA